MRGNASSCGSPVLLGRWETCGPLLSLFSRRNPAAFVLCYLRSCFRVFLKVPALSDHRPRGCSGPVFGLCLPRSESGRKPFWEYARRGDACTQKVSLFQKASGFGSRAHGTLARRVFSPSARTYFDGDSDKKEAVAKWKHDSNLSIGTVKRSASLKPETPSRMPIFL